MQENDPLQIMETRRIGLNRMAALPGPQPARRPFADMRVDIRQHAVEPKSNVPRSLVGAIAGRLVRDCDRESSGSVLVTGLSSVFDLQAVQGFHQALFQAVWADFSLQSREVSEYSDHRLKPAVTTDGKIPVADYGSNWSYKELHADREALLFSQLYGPVAGFTGGALLLVDVRAYMRMHHLKFDEIFTWSDEPTPGSKPTLRVDYRDGALSECGTNLGVLGPDEILFVNNCPSAGILHGVTPVVVTDPARFVRIFARWSASGSLRSRCYGP